MGVKVGEYRRADDRAVARAAEKRGIFTAAFRAINYEYRSSHAGGIKGEFCARYNIMSRALNSMEKVTDEYIWEIFDTAFTDELRRLKRLQRIIRDQSTEMTEVKQGA